MRLNEEIKALDDKEDAAVKALKDLPRNSNGRRMTHVKDVVTKFSARLNRMCATGGETVENLREEIALACKEAVDEAAMIGRCEASVLRLGFDARDDDLVNRHLYSPRKSDEKRADRRGAYAIMEDALKDAFMLSNEHTCSLEKCASALKPLGFSLDDDLRDSLARDFPLVANSRVSNHPGEAIPAVDVHEDDNLFVNREMNVAMLLRREISSKAYCIHTACAADVHHITDSGSSYMVNEDLRYLSNDRPCASRLGTRAIIEALGSSATGTFNVRELTERLNRIKLVNRAERELMLHAPGITHTKRDLSRWRPEMFKAIAEGAPIYMCLYETDRSSAHATMDTMPAASIDICIEGVNLYEIDMLSARPTRTVMLHVIVP